MISRSPRILLAALCCLLAALCCLLALATSASAECAWVLWDRSAKGQDIPDSRPWSRTAAYATRNDCWAKIRDLTFVPMEGSIADTMSWLFRTGVYDPASHRYRGLNGVTLFLGEGVNTEMIEYRCLPDTMDPRGPKGK